MKDILSTIGRLSSLVSLVLSALLSPLVLFSETEPALSKQKMCPQNAREGYPSYFISVPVINMRQQPDPESEVVSQAFFSERVLPITSQGDWVEIETTVDQYRGWVPKSVFCERAAHFSDGEWVMVNRLSAHLYRQRDTIRGPLLTLPFESRLAVREADDARWLTVELPE